MSEEAPRKREKAADIAEITGPSHDRRRPRGSSPAEPVPGTAGRKRTRGRRPQRSSAPQTQRTMLVHADPRGTQIAVLEESQIVEHYVARSHDRSIVGNVYLGRVQNVLPGMEASFVDVGEARNGVLYAGEVGIAGDEGDEVPRIETVLKPGQSILVQVTKDPMRSKGARLTALVSIAGRHLVLVPNADSIGVSRRLPDRERARLRDIANALKPAGHGLIVRTAAEGASRSDIERDLERLIQVWDEISAKAARSKAPSLIYEEPELELRVIRDLFNRDIARCVVDDRELESVLRAYIRQTTPDLDHRLELYEGQLPTLEETVFKTNMEAAVEVARQLRLRDIGGIIVIDFIDMEILDNRDEVIKSFRRELETDRTRTQVFDISQLGLVQMTRKNVSTGIVEAFSDPCPQCEGRGLLIHDLD